MRNHDPLRLLTLIFGLLLCVGAIQADPKHPQTSSGPGASTPAFILPGRAESTPGQDLQEQVIGIFEENCAYAGCHAGANAPANMDLSEEAFLSSLVKVRSQGVPQFLRVKPGDAAISYIIKKLRGAPDIKGDRMPRGADPLPEQQINTIEQWINGMPADVAVEEPKREYAQAFYGWTLSNLPTAETVEKGGFLYRIAHRFKSSVDEGFDQLFGLDGGAFMMTQVAFPITNDLTFTGERSGLNATFEFGAKWRFLREKSDGSMPISAALYAGTDWATAKGIADPADQEKNLSRTAGERFSFFAQLPVTKSLGKRISLMAVPGVLLKGNVGVEDEDALITIGAGGKLALSQRYALFAEIVPIVAGDETAATVGGARTDEDELVYNDTFTAGLEIKAGGHVFHVFVTNSGGNTTNQYMSGGNFDFADGDFRLGFNIYRLLNYPF